MQGGGYNYYKQTLATREISNIQCLKRMNNEAELGQVIKFTNA